MPVQLNHTIVAARDPHASATFPREGVKGLVPAPRHLSGRPGQLPTPAPTDPDVRNSRIRLFGSWFRREHYPRTLR